MNSTEFRQWAKEKIIVLDGATGMNLIKAGMPKGACPEQWIIENPQAVIDLQRAYIEAGTNIIYAPTFTANRLKLAEYGLENDIAGINRTLVRLSKEAACGKALVAGDLSMTGRQLKPVGDMEFEDLVNIYKEQVSCILMEGVDLFVIETMMSLNECRAALLAVKEVCDLPVMVTLTFNEDNRTLFGTDAKTALLVMQSMGADAVGLNCSTGPDRMADIVEDMVKYATVPIIAKPNAGLPKLVNGETVYDMNAEEFAKGMEKLINKGVSIVGGCCGTTPEHIRQLVDTINKKQLKSEFTGEYKCTRAVTTERHTLDIDIDGRFIVVGERINPTGKKNLQEELRNGCFDLVASMAEEQVELGADILDINCGMNGIDEKETFLKVMDEVMRVTDVPLSIDSSYVEVIESALRIYPGRALINSISYEKEKMERLLPIAKKYGAMFILLPLSEKGLPKSLEEKMEIIDNIIKKALDIGLSYDDIIVDGLVTTVGANKRAAIEVLETISYCKSKGIATICGLSNISFGLPARQYVNSTFLATAINQGLTMAIANPSQELLMNTAFASDLLRGIDNADVKYIERVSINDDTKDKVVAIDKKQTNRVFEAVVKGNRQNIISIVKDEIGENPTKENASDIVNEVLIPAINHVGKLFEKQIYFLPQLISSAEAMKNVMDFLEPFLGAADGAECETTIVIATVEGDIHDIGKNLVALMLKNYGYNVIDLGKDISARHIVDKSIEYNASIIALSALMTTTMLEMKKVVDIVRQENLDIKVIIGGAVVTQNFCEEIGADGYSKDANEAVKLVKSLTI